MDPGETVPSRVSLYLEIENYSPMSEPFISKLTNSKPIHHPLLLGSYSLGYYSHALTTLGPGTSELGTTLISQSQRKLFKLANPNPPYTAIHRKAKRFLPMFFPCSICFLTFPNISPRCGNLGPVSKKVSFQR